MGDELNLVRDLALILISAGVFTIISKALKQPLILGYIVAGFLVGPHMGLFPSITSMESVKQWSDIGIIFLLFGLGLEFSFKKLLKVGSAALITAGTKCVGMFIVGITAGAIMGWTSMESIFLGGLLSMSSTTIIIKAYDDMGLKKKPYSTLIFGSLVFEDLIAVLLLVLLSTLAVSNKFAGGEMLGGLAKLAFFIILWFLIGIYLIPSILKKAKQFLTDEILLIVGIGLCFGMVVFANAVGFSSALGAFVMGSILAETVEGERIEKLTVQIKDLFGAIFFVSVGMMLDPAVLWEHAFPIIFITLVAMGGILIFSTTGALISGQGLTTAVHAGFSLAQLGEFAFIIAGLGCSLGVMREFIYPVIIAVSVITTFTTPYMIKAADPVLAWLYRKLPAKVVARIEPVKGAPKASSGAAKDEWKKLLKGYFLRIALYSVMLIAIMTAANKILEPFVTKLTPSWNGSLRSAILAAVTLAAMSPFLYGLATSGGHDNASAKRLLNENQSNRWPLLALIILRILLSIAFVLVVVLSLFSMNWWSVLLLALALFIIFMIIRGKVRKSSFIEKKFLSNLNEKEMNERKKNLVAKSVGEKLSGYDVHIEPFEVSPDFAFVGKPLREMPFRHRSGVNILKIQRGSNSIIIPSGDEVIYPHDVLMAVGTTEQIESFEAVMKEAAASSADSHAVSSEEEFTVESFCLSASSVLVGKALREINMRSNSCMVISIMRGTKFITNPKPEFVFLEGDRVWLAGEKTGVAWYR